MAGNPLTVIRDADAVPDEAMARLARRLRLSETSFVQTATVPDATYRHRIWMPTGEIPFAGHPSIGTAVSVALARGLGEADFVQQTPSGLQSLHVEIAAGRGGGTASLRQNPLVQGEVVDPVPVLQAFGLDATDILNGLPAQVVSTGLESLILPLRSVEALGRVRMNHEAVTNALRGIAEWERMNCYFVAQVTPDTWRARNLSVTIVGWEDPATGSAAGPFGGWLALHGGPSRITVLQGVEMGDPSRIDVDVSDGIVISGPVLVRATGSIDL